MTVDVLRNRLLPIFSRRCLGVTLLLVSHPALGEVALVQPLLLAAAIHRVFNWGRDPDPVFELLLQVGGQLRATAYRCVPAHLLIRCLRFLLRSRHIGGCHVAYL